MMNKLKHQIIYWFPVYIYAIIIFYFSSLPNVFVYAPSVLKPIFMDVSHIIYHIVEYIILGFFLLFSMNTISFPYSSIYLSL